MMFYFQLYEDMVFSMLYIHWFSLSYRCLLNKLCLK
uniref:Uncharacterized protein n=1 Tax=Arundo donax TaxID=35708 RepID=A0A0A8Z728_ARUDO